MKKSRRVSKKQAGDRSGGGSRGSSEGRGVVGWSGSWLVGELDLGLLKTGGGGVRKNQVES